MTDLQSETSANLAAEAKLKEALLSDLDKVNYSEIHLRSAIHLRVSI